MSAVRNERSALPGFIGVHVVAVAVLSFVPVLPVKRTGIRTEPLPVVIANDNRSKAGRLRGNVLKVDLVVRMARWYPESNDGPFADVEAFAEEGRAPRIPAPLIRVPAGTVIEATIRNALPESTITIVGMSTRPDVTADSVRITPGATRTLRFAAGAPGTYLYRALVGKSARRVAEREQLAGAFIVDSANARKARDRVFVINIWGNAKDSVTYRHALTINGKSWPHTERLSATVGDSVRWRVINASGREHPMHLHGFYFRVDARGDATRDTIFAPERQRLAVTESLQPGTTTALTWFPTRPGNWLFHCHLSFHVVPEARLDPPSHGHSDNHAQGPDQHMAGLVLGIAVKPGRKWVEPREGAPRRMRLFVQEGRRRGHAPRTLGFVLPGEGADPPSHSASIPGATLVLTRDEPTHITVINRLNEPTGVHWHGIELESYSDGVVGWSGEGKRIAPAIAPRDSFTAHLTLPRAGTFIYHTHLNDIEQLTSGLYGAIIVLEPGARFDPRTDHLFIAGWDGVGATDRLLVNGDSQPPPITMAFGERHRIRLVNIGPAGFTRFALLRDSAAVRWRALAKDGAELPAGQALEGPARTRLTVGETADFEFVPTERGRYVIAVQRFEGGWRWHQQIDVK